MLQRRIPRRQHTHGCDLKETSARRASAAATSAFSICFDWLLSSWWRGKHIAAAFLQFVSLRGPAAELPLRAGVEPAACRAAPGSPTVGPNVTKPAARRCPSSLSPAVTGC
ncbi:uncharacterized protein V6R79_024913 [Siganus canaliculatus]